ncbi:MAG TPA: S-layer family protein, partial [Croceibacterium sp.]|nr:S-layer family protein [Croceibacterium sp.]
TTTAGVTLAANSDLSAPAALNGGSITVGGNATTALARGNTATNALNYAAGANYGTGTGNPAHSSLAVNGGDAGVNGVAVAQAAVLNAQVNTGAVSASAGDVMNGVVLNGDGGFPLVTNGSVRVAGNSVSAAAYGNTANNRLTLASLNTGQPTAAVANYQANSGPVTASITSVTYGVGTGFGSTTGSALSVTGNQVTATAVGNSAVNTIGAQ